MELKAQIETGIKDAMRAGDDVKKRTLRMAPGRHQNGRNR